MITLTEEQAVELQDLVYQADYEARIRWSYSGRHMYGNECVGIVASDVSAILRKIMRGMSDELAEIIEDQDMAWDIIGRREIGYWPRIASEYKGDDE